MKIIHWIGIDDHADNWTIAHLRGSEEKPSKEFELIPNEAGYRKLLAFAKALGATARIVYEAGPCGYDLYRRLNKAGLRCDVAAPSLTPQGEPSTAAIPDTRQQIVIHACKTEAAPDGSCSCGIQPAHIRMIIVAASLSADTTAATTDEEPKERGRQRRKRQISESTRYASLTRSLISAAAGFTREGTKRRDGRRDQRHARRERSAAGVTP